MNLKQKALDVLQKNKGSWVLIARETGLNYQWISKFAQGRIANPGVDNIELLFKWDLENK